MNGTAKHEPVKTDAAPEGGSELRFFLIAVVLAAAFALVPRSLSSCRSAQRGEDAPDFTASVVANPLDNKPLTKESAIALASLKGHPVLLDFWATWCGPCRSMAPAFAQAAAQLKGQAVLAKVDTDANPKLAARFGIRSIPTLVRLDGGRETARQAGALPLGAIVSMVR